MSKNEYKEKDIVISSRVRLARNIRNLPFPIYLQSDSAKDIVEVVEKSINDKNNNLTPFNKIKVEDITANNKKMLVEKHLTSPEWGRNDHAAVFIREDERVSIMVNEEDHIRIQCILDGFQLNYAYDIANEIDDLLEEEIRYAFDEKYGYLTACPSNVGTGMRASVMLHLPSLTLSNQMNNLMQTLARFGITIRGIYGEGTQAMGDLYQISNQTTLGIKEQDIISNIHSVAKEIIKRERDLRYEVLNNNKTYLEDKIFRALGTLTNARTISVEESMKLISLVRLGTDLELIDQDIKKINDLMITIQPGILLSLYDTADLQSFDVDKLRANFIRKSLIKNT
ncbi:protein arginine kinase [Alkalibaculum sporogenes]|nr:protein arginine kinase [Alkalibaculum sporogenes]